MGVLKVKDAGGNWVPVGVGINNFGVENGSYTPTPADIGIGAGGTSVGYYTFIGGLLIGDVGMMHASGTITFGSSGITFGGVPRVTLPNGYRVNSEAPNVDCGSLRVFDASPASWPGFGMVAIWSDTHFSFEMFKADTVNLTSGAINTTTPITWAVGDKLMWNANIQARRV